MPTPIQQLQGQTPNQINLNPATSQTPTSTPTYFQTLPTAEQNLITSEGYSPSQVLGTKYGAGVITNSYGSGGQYVDIAIFSPSGGGPGGQGPSQSTLRTQLLSSLGIDQATEATISAYLGSQYSANIQAENAGGTNFSVITSNPSGQQVETVYRGGVISSTNPYGVPSPTYITPGNNPTTVPSYLVPTQKPNANIFIAPTSNTSSQIIGQVRTVPVFQTSQQTTSQTTNQFANVSNLGRFQIVNVGGLTLTQTPQYLTQAQIAEDQAASRFAEQVILSAQSGNREAQAFLLGANTIFADIGTTAAVISGLGSQTRTNPKTGMTEVIGPPKTMEQISAEVQQIQFEGLRSYAKVSGIAKGENPLTPSNVFNVFQANPLTQVAEAEIIGEAAGGLVKPGIQAIVPRVSTAIEGTLLGESIKPSINYLVNNPALLETAGIGLIAGTAVVQAKTQGPAQALVTAAEFTAFGEGISTGLKTGFPIYRELVVPSGVPGVPSVLITNTEKLPLEKYVTPEVLSGKEPYPKVTPGPTEEQVNQMLKDFYSPQYKLTGKTTEELNPEEYAKYLAKQGSIEYNPSASFIKGSESEKYLGRFTENKLGFPSGPNIKTSPPLLSVSEEVASYPLRQQIISHELVHLTESETSLEQVIAEQQKFFKPELPGNPEQYLPYEFKLREQLAFAAQNPNEIYTVSTEKPITQAGFHTAPEPGMKGNIVWINPNYFVVDVGTTPGGPGLHLAPSLSPAFFGLGGEGEASYSKLITGLENPVATFDIPEEGVGRMPSSVIKEIRATGSRTPGAEFLLSTEANLGKGYITPAAEAGKTEEEVLVPVGAVGKVTEVNAKYIRYQGVNIPVITTRTGNIPIPEDVMNEFLSSGPARNPYTSVSEYSRATSPGLGLSVSGLEEIGVSKTPALSIIPSSVASRLNSIIPSSSISQLSSSTPISRSSLISSGPSSSSIIPSSSILPSSSPSSSAKSISSSLISSSSSLSSSPSGSPSSRLERIYDYPKPSSTSPFYYPPTYPTKSYKKSKPTSLLSKPKKKGKLSRLLPLVDLGSINLSVLRFGKATAPKLTEKNIQKFNIKYGKESQFGIYPTQEQITSGKKNNLRMI